VKKERILNKVDGNAYLTVDEASQALGVKPNAIRNYLYLGKFTTYKFKNLTMLDLKEVNGWKGRQK